jgi:hypothetical protein
MFVLKINEEKGTIVLGDKYSEGQVLTFNGTVDVTSNVGSERPTQFSWVKPSDLDQALSEIPVGTEITTHTFDKLEDKEYNMWSIKPI